MIGESLELKARMEMVTYVAWQRLLKQKANMEWIRRQNGRWLFEAPLKSHSHLHVGTSPLQKPLGPHILVFDPTSIYPSGQTYSIVDPTVLLDPTIVVFSDFSGLPQVGGPVKQIKNRLSMHFYETFHVNFVSFSFNLAAIFFPREYWSDFSPFKVPIALTALTDPVKVIKIAADIIPEPAATSVQHDAILLAVVVVRLVLAPGWLLHNLACNTIHF